ncbi:MAG TPA: hypothetical protein VGS57_20185 [Thermoanaerobaculia bacterium]|jgi:hypothetical protein|nr:hypothetical protein [Thermoanaerobaculia bacterium]
MGEPQRARLLFLALLALALPATAQEPTPTPTPAGVPLQASRQRLQLHLQATALRDAIRRLPAAAVEQAVVTLTPGAATPPATTTAPNAAPATPEAGPATAPATPTLTADIAEVKPAPAKLRAREILFVPLKADDEAKTREAVVAQMQTTHWTSGGFGGTARDAPVQVFEGAIRTLAAAGTELTLKAVVRGGSPLRYVADRRRFEGSINVGVVDIGAQGAARKLSEPIVFQVTGPLTATPDLARVENTAPPLQTIALVGDSMDPAVEVLVTSSVTPEGVTFKVPVTPALFVDVTPRRILGWGLELADVELNARALPAGGNRQVQLVADSGTVEPRRLTLDAGGTGEATLRSASIGKSSVTVSGPTFAAATVPIEFVFPTWFLLAGLVGGVAGGSLRIGLPRPGRLGRFLARLGAAVTCGFLVLGLYVLGVNVVGFKLPARAGEVLVFVVAALGALGGVGLLKPGKPAS